MVNNPLPPDLQQQIYVNEYREYKKGFKTGERPRSSLDPLYLVETLVRLFIALARVLFIALGWLLRTVLRKPR